MSEPDGTVFVVDDDPSVRRSTERLVRSLGFNVQTFASATEFKDQARVDGPACLVLDVQLPGLSGLDLQRELAQSRVQLPIIFMTGRGSIPMSVRAMKEGAVEFLTKPARVRDLQAAITAAIEQDRGSRRARRDADALRERYERLTARERKVMTFVVAGLLNKADRRPARDDRADDQVPSRAPHREDGSPLARRSGPYGGAPRRRSSTLTRTCPGGQLTPVPRDS